MTTMINQLNDYGANTKEAMDRMVNDEAFYKECLITFTTDPGFEKLGQAIQNKDAEAAFESAHALKGVAGNLGLDPLY